MSHDDHAGAGEPVLISLSTPARRSLVTGLLRAPGSSAPGERIVDADIPDTELAAFLAAAAHTDAGFVARTDDGPRAVAVVAGTVAALIGEDIPRALTDPDIAFLTGLKPPAIEALRGVLLGIETGAEALVSAALTVLEP